MTEHAPEATTLLERYDQLKSINAELLEALKDLTMITEDGEFKHSNARYAAKRAIRKAEEQVK